MKLSLVFNGTYHDIRGVERLSELKPSSKVINIGSNDAMDAAKKYAHAISGGNEPVTIYAKVVNFDDSNDFELLEF